MLKISLCSWGNYVVLLRTDAWKTSRFFTAVLFTTHARVDNTTSLSACFGWFFRVVSHIKNRHFSGVKGRFLHIINNPYKDNNEYKYLIT